MLDSNLMPSDQPDLVYIAVDKDNTYKKVIRTRKPHGATPDSEPNLVL